MADRNTSQVEPPMTSYTYVRICCKGHKDMWS